MERAVILVAHGSSLSDWSRPFISFQKRLEQGSGDVFVALSFLQDEGSSLEQSIGVLIEKGIHHFDIWPLFLSSGTHVQKDIPAIMQNLHAQYSFISWKQSPPLLEDDNICLALAERLI